MEGCAPFDATQGYAMALTRYVDCQASLLGEGGYSALAAANSPVILALGGLLTILIAIQGYRLLLGDQPQIRDGILLAAKIGLALAFATQWSAYRSVVYNLTVEAPRDLLTVFPGAGGEWAELPARLQGSYQLVAEIVRPSPNAAPQNVQPAQAASAAGSAATVPAPMAFSLAGNPLLSAAAILLLVSGLAVLISVRLIAGLLLALGPLFFACLLFDTTRGLFEGWVRGLVGTAVASISTAVLLGIEISIIEPQLENLVTVMAAGALPVMAPGDIGDDADLPYRADGRTAISFKIGAGFRFLERGLAIGSQLSRRWQASSLTEPRQLIEQRTGSPSAPADEGRSRGALIADSIRASDQWAVRPVLAGAASEVGRRIELSAQNGSEPRPTPIGQSYRRTGNQRNTKSISQRNNRT